MNLKTYQPLIVIVTLIALVAYVTSADSLTWMRHFMAGFFLVFAGFKLIDVPGFAHGYKKYDLIASAIPAYGYVYPFIELGLGLAYLTNYQPLLINWITFVIMLIGAAGVSKALVQGMNIQCACLGTKLNLPLSSITIIEDIAMAAMAGVMILGLM